MGTNQHQTNYMDPYGDDNNNDYTMADRRRRARRGRSKMLRAMKIVLLVGPIAYFVPELIAVLGEVWIPPLEVRVLNLLVDVYVFLKLSQAFMKLFYGMWLVSVDPIPVVLKPYTGRLMAKIREVTNDG